MGDGAAEVEVVGREVGHAPVVVGHPEGSMFAAGNGAEGFGAVGGGGVLSEGGEGQQASEEDSGKMFHKDLKFDEVVLGGVVLENHFFGS